jgi:hypothetical protein
MDDRNKWIATKMRIGALFLAAAVLAPFGVYTLSILIDQKNL